MLQGKTINKIKNPLELSQKQNTIDNIFLACYWFNKTEKWNPQVHNVVRNFNMESIWKRVYTAL